MYIGYAEDGMNNAKFSFEDDELVSKAQFSLKIILWGLTPHSINDNISLL